MRNHLLLKIDSSLIGVKVKISPLLWKALLWDDKSLGKGIIVCFLCIVVQFRLDIEECLIVAAYEIVFELVFELALDM